MRVVLVSSPGDPAGAPAAGHWSHAAAADLARVLLVSGAHVEWFRVAHDGDDLPPPPPGTQMHAFAVRPFPLHRVAAANDAMPVEIALNRSLRAHHANVVVHLGAGARGSPNIAWIANRMGSVAHAIVRATEVVCHRGTLVDADNRPCTIADDAERCRSCCSRSWLQRARAFDFVDRLDLLVGSLVLAAGVFVASAAEAERLAGVGVPRTSLVTTHDVQEIAARIAGRDAVSVRGA